MKKYVQLYAKLHDGITNGEYPPRMQLPTENALAQKYDVSRQTVRQALNMLRDEGCIYSVQGSGSFVALPGLRTTENKRIAVITTYFSEYIFPSILRGISETAMNNGYTIELNSTNNSISLEKKILTQIMQNPAAGVVVEGTKSALPNPNASFYQKLADTGVPIVFINSVYPEVQHGNMVSVVTDDFQGGYDTAKHLIDKGYGQAIGCICKSDDAQGIARFAGIMAALADNGIDFDDRNFVWFTTETKYSFIKALLTSNFFTGCRAIICYNDEVVEILSSFLQDIHHNVEMLAGFDRNMNKNILPAAVDYYSLAHPKELLGKTAAEKLINMLSGQPESSVVLPWND